MYRNSVTAQLHSTTATGFYRTAPMVARDLTMGYARRPAAYRAAPGIILSEKKYLYKSTRWQ